MSPRPDEAKYHPRRRSDEHYASSPRAGETAWRARTGPVRNVPEPIPCHNCGHHPGSHRGWQGQEYARCDECCQGYRDEPLPELAL